MRPLPPPHTHTPRSPPPHTPHAPPPHTHTPRSPPLAHPTPPPPLTPPTPPPPPSHMAQQEIVEQILKAKAQQNDSVVFAWWGTESLKTKKALARLFAKYEGQVRVEHIEHANPAAQGDLFCRPKASPHPHFAHINAVLTRAGRPEVDWLPDAAWLAARAPRAAGGGAGAMADFIAQTKELHKLYLERLQSGLEHAADLPPIRGILASEGVGLLEACAPLGLAPAAGKSLRAAEALPRGALSLDEAAAVHMYTGNALYARLNEALRHPNRGLVARYVPYLRLLLAALARLLAARAPLFRGIRKDLAAAYPEGATVTWWSVSSCTPDVAVAKGFGGGQKGGTLFRVQAEAVPIMGLSAFKGEEEYVLAPGTQLKVVKVDRDPAGAVVISLEEQPGPRLVS